MNTPTTEEMNTPTTEQQRRFWDEHWDQWRERKTLSEWKDRRHAAIVARLSALSLRDPEIIDLGCGPGYYTQNLSKFGHTTGLDLSEHAIEKAREKYPGIEFIAGNLYDYPLPHEHYDVVVAQEAFDHVEDQKRFLDRVYEILVPGGYLIVSCTNRFVTDRMQNGELANLGPAHIKKFLTIGEFKQLLRRRFHVVEVTSIIPIGQHGILRLINSHKFNRILRSSIPPRQLDALRGKLGLGYQLIAVARRPQ